MDENKNRVAYIKALSDFRHARSRAELERLWAGLTGKSLDLLRFDEITKKMKTMGLSSKGLQEIPLDAIVGSVNRYQDFDKQFRPLRDDDLQRWARVKAVMTSPNSAGLPPIRVYKIGEAYFVLDGNHRVSIAREMGIESIEAYVTEIRTRVGLSPEDSPEEIILKQEYAKFLSETHFDEVFPDVDLRLTFPGQYDTLREHIEVHRYFMGLDQKKDISYEEALRHWYEEVYLPVIQVIRDQDILRAFPDRTETDMYLWVLDHQSSLQEMFGWRVRTDMAASDLVNEKGAGLKHMVRRVGEKVLSVLLPKELEDFSKPGEWHEHKNLMDQSLFSDILVPMSGEASGWTALFQAISLANLEGSEIRGLIVGNPSNSSEEKLRNIEAGFRRALEEGGVAGQLTYRDGQIAEVICNAARLNDLVVLRMSYPPSTKFLERMSSGFRMILRRCTRPILVVKSDITNMDHMLLAYDGSPKSQEALFVAAYFSRRYGHKITVLVVESDEDAGQALIEDAETYLGDCCFGSQFVQKVGDAAEKILLAAESVGANLIVMGGYGYSPLLEALLGSTVDDVLRDTTIPVLVCQ